MIVSPFLSSTCNCVQRWRGLGITRGAWLPVWVHGVSLDKGSERACTKFTASAGSVSVAVIAAAVAIDATDAAAGSVTSAGAAVVGRLPEGVSSALTKNVDVDCRRCCLSGSPTLPLLFVNSATGAS